MQRPEILFDHFYIILSPEHYTAMKADKIWNDLFATTYESTVKTGEGNEWTGFYCTTLDHRYVELFYEGPRLTENYIVGAAGVGFCSETIENTPALVAYYEANYTDAKPSVVPRTLNSRKLGRTIPWFTYVMPSDHLQTPFLKPWIMDYQHDYIRAAQVNMRNENQFDRDQFSLTGLDIKPDQAQIKSIKKVALECTQIEFDRLTKQLIALGAVLLPSQEFQFGPFCIQIECVEKVKMRIKKVEFEMTNVLDMEHTILQSKISAKGTRLIWEVSYEI